MVMSDIEDGVRAAIARYVQELWNEHDVAALDRFVPADYELPLDELREKWVGLRAVYGTSPRPMRGVELLKIAAQADLDLIDDHRVEILRTVAEGRRIAWMWEMTGIRRHPPDGTDRTIRFRGIALYELSAEEQIVRREGVVNRLDFLHQVGLVRRRWNLLVPA